MQDDRCKMKCDGNSGCFTIFILIWSLWFFGVFGCRGEIRQLRAEVRALRAEIQVVLAKENRDDAGNQENAADAGR